MEKLKTQKCKNCAFYYYKQWSSFYSRLNHGFCIKHKKPQTQSETCEDYKSNEQKEKTREEKLFSSLEYALKSINEIAQILKERH